MNQLTKFTVLGDYKILNRVEFDHIDFRPFIDLGDIEVWNAGSQMQFLLAGMVILI